jgi:ferredoxin
VKVSVNRDRCEGHGLCEATAHELFQLDNEGDLILLFDGQELPKEQVNRAMRAVHSCPVAALRIEN